MDWEEACARVALMPQERDSIGKLSEKTIHAVCKFYREPDERLHEVRVEGLVADVCREDGSIVEVQTRNFDRLREKLTRFLPEHEVEVVYPLPARKQIIWMAEDGTLGEPSLSPKRGRHTDACYELWRIKEFLGDEHLTVRLLFIDVDEYRLLNGWSKDKKHGSTRVERIPGALREELLLRDLAEYEEAFVPELTFLGEFTAAEFQKENRMTKRLASYTIGFLREIGAVEKTGTRGRAYLYRRAGEMKESGTGEGAQDERCETGNDVSAKQEASAAGVRDE